MTLTTRHRSSIFQALRPILGEEEADALLAEFPAAEHDQLVTKEFLRAEVAELELRLNHRIAASTVILSVVVGASTTFLSLVG